MKTHLEKLRAVRIQFSMRERLVIIAAMWWFLKNVTPNGFQSVFARRLLELMLKSSVEPEIIVEADVTTFDFLGSVMSNYREIGSISASEADYVEDVIDKCNPVTEVYYEETVELTVIEFIAIV